MDIGDNTVILTVTDGSGNVSTCSATVTILDNVAPMAVCQAHTLQLNGIGAGGLTTSDIDGGSSDACGNITLSAMPTTFGCMDVGTNTVILTVTDGSGNVSTCSASVTVEDNLAPIVACPSSRTLSLELGQCGQFSTEDLPSFTDNCGATITTVSAPTNDDFLSINCDTRESDPILYSYLIEDGSGNVTSCSYELTFIESPSATNDRLSCNDEVNVSVNNLCEIEFTADMLLEGGNFGCLDCFIITPAEIFMTGVDGNVFDVSVTDPVSGNSCWTRVNVEDKNDPELVCDICTDPTVSDPSCVFNCTEEKLFSDFVDNQTGRVGVDEDVLDDIIEFSGDRGGFIDEFVTENCSNIPIFADYSDSFSTIGDCTEGVLMTRLWSVTFPSVGGGNRTLNCTQYFRFDPFEIFDDMGNLLAMEAPFDTIQLNPDRFCYQSKS